MDAHQRRGEEDWKPKTRQEGRELRVPLGRACKDAKKRDVKRDQKQKIHPK